jgi:D-tyrosyl-tRNA(Tyr) deacylase
VRAVLQRVAHASVSVDGRPVARIGRGCVLFVGVGHDDAPADAHRLAEKVATLRIFADPLGTMNLALPDVGGEVLVVSQFTLFADLGKGRRPSWSQAAEPGMAAGLVERVAADLEDRGFVVGRGVFGADMQVELLNNGPVTLMLDTDTL